MLNAKLVVVGGDAKAKEINLRLPCIIGRSREATLTLPHPLVSRQHTEITERDGRLFVKDLGSLNGTFLDNNRLEKEELLEPNQLLTLGNVTFRAVYEIGTEVVSCETLQQGESKPGSIELRPVSNSAGIRQSDRETVYEDQRISSESSDTDKSFVSEDSTKHEQPHEKEIENQQPAVAGPSNIFVEIEGVDTVVPASSLEGLPEAPSAMSFASGVDFSGDTQPEAEPVSSVEMDFVEEDQKKPAEGSGLDSFIKKLPR